MTAPLLRVVENTPGDRGLHHITWTSVGLYARKSFLPELPKNCTQYHPFNKCAIQVGRKQ